ncbi:MAG: magnesium chelatase subunit H [Bradyrhizobiaceae bacterium]|nr:MAG: magnesium chelatase subunit H [Bradyrhizobiaceae bacterium]
MPKRITPDSTAPTGAATPLRVVIVTMDSHLSGAAARAQQVLRREFPSLTIAVHSADEWGTNPAALSRCLDAIAAGDIVIATMLFLDEHVRAVFPALQARRDHCDAMIGCMSAAEVVKLTRVGKFDMSGEALGAISWLKKLRGKRDGKPVGGKSEMTMLRRLPKLLRFIPGTAQDMRAYFLTLQYWLAGSERNIVNMVRLLVDRYADGARRGLRGIVKAEAPIDYPDIGVYHPRMKGQIADAVDQLPMPGANGTVGLLLLRSYLLAGNAGHYDGVIKSFEAKGLRVIPAFASGLDQRPAIERFFMKDGRCGVDAVVSLTGFSLVGGPAYNDARAAEEILAKLDVPYLSAHPVEFQTLEQWAASDRGLMPVESTIMVAIPELDGASGPTVYGGRSDGAGAPCSGCDRHCVFPNAEIGGHMHVCSERADMLAARTLRLVAMRRAARRDRKVAVVLFNFPPNAANTGTAAFLSVFESLHRTLSAMKREGYDVDVPADANALRERIVTGNAARFGADANVHVRIPAGDHVRQETYLGEIEAQWGPAPGKQQSDGASIFVLGERFGNVFVGIQPAFGYEGDPMRLLFEKGFAPTHAFSAFYRWLREDFGAHAVLHFGTHGALEFMPGKQAGLSASCWPDRMIGDLPNIYLYASNNPSEGTIAKRRSAATLISYLTPPIAHAGLYKGLVELKASIAPHGARPAPQILARLVQGEAPEMLAAVSDTAELSLYRELAATDKWLAEDHEIPSILHALDGKFVRPAPGGDILRTPAILPTGRNLHGFDPFRIPSAFAVQDGAEQAQRLLDKHMADGNSLPESVAIVLWGTDNLKNEGAPIAQALALLGARPRFDGYGRLTGAELISLECLARPRIDVIITMSGIFRDLLPLQIKLLAEACFLAASADEPLAQNFVRKHALAYQTQHGCDMETASLRVFGNADGAYGSNVNHLVENGRWDDEDELAETYTRRKSFAYGVKGSPVQQSALLTSVLATVDLAYQNLDSVELGVTTVDHYFDTLGGISRAVKRAKGGTSAPVYIGDQTRGAGAVRTLSEQVALETRTRMLNPKWYEGMLKHGYEGVRQIEEHVTNTMGWSATTGEVAPWVYRQLTETFVLDPEMRERLAKLNPVASAKVANRLIEAQERKYWSPDPEMLDVLRRASDELEDRLEGVGVAA